MTGISTAGSFAAGLFAAAPLTPDPSPTRGEGRIIRLGIARDEAFHFYYPDNLETLQRLGAELVPFSPLDDASLPVGLDGLYFGGGYPEVHAERLAANPRMLRSVRQFAESGRAVYAECGGLMYLGRSVASLDGRRHMLVGLVPLDTAMRPSLKTLGYTEVTLTADSLWGTAGAVCRGHEFHYSEITADDSPSDDWRRVYAVRRRRGEMSSEGFCRGAVLASYVHLHWGARPDAARTFLSRCENPS